jgi:acyl-CoA synthetase (AMP-forming)/AMP-acid ligase II
MIAHQETQSEYASLVDLVRQRAAENPDAALFAFLPDGEDGVAATMTRGELERRARAIAVRLQNLGLTGGRALLLYPSGLEFIAAFFGCLYAGVVAVPAHLPKINRPMPRIRAIVRDAEPCTVLTSSSQQNNATRWEIGVPEIRGLHRLVTDEEVGNLAELAGRWKSSGARTDSLGFLQYTSGSTAAPKGVMITHANLLENSAWIQASFGSTAESRGVFWLPLFHDMGLIGGVIQTIYRGGSSTLISPVSFLQRPLRWLQAISRTGATISGAPNFAYDLCVEKTTTEQRAQLDLSRWNVAFNGAEPVRPDTLDRFAHAFAPAGFRREAFLACYGLAEATLLVSGSAPGHSPVVLSVDAAALARDEIAETQRANQGRQLAGSGQVAAGHRVVVVDPATLMPCTQNRVGEIWVTGPSVARGYWKQPTETVKVFRAMLGEGDGRRAVPSHRRPGLPERWRALRYR